MASDDTQLRQKSLVFYRDDIDRIAGILKDFLRLSQSKCALLVDKDGHLVCNVGETASYDTDTISALVAGSFAATKEMARILGEKEFSVLFHQGQKDNIQLSLIADRALLTVIFDERTTIGMVRLYANQTAERLSKVFREILTRSPSAGGEDRHEVLDSDFRKTAKAQLDKIFGEE